jgi:hypothetical protein
LNLLEGTPNGMEIFNNITMRLPVKFKGATSSHITTGSKGGTNLIFTVLGVGVKNTGTMNFLDSSLAELCESVVIERYSEVQCMTKLGIDVNQTL